MPPSDSGTSRGHLGVRTGAGLVVSNMVGATVFVSAGFMAQEMDAGTILLAWVVGAVAALSGARVYAQVAEWVPRSGGEYRFLSDLLHPAVGYLAGWASLLVGFSAPIAANALAAGAFAATLAPSLHPIAVGTVVIVALTGVHALGLRISKLAQNALVAVDVVLLLAFVGVGFTLGSWEWPTWTPPQSSDGFPAAAFFASLFYVALAYSGWNAAVYAASEFRDPRRDVPRAMLIGCGSVAVLYLAVNWVLVANITPEIGKVVFEYEATRVTLGHVVIRDLVGEGGAAVMSILSITAFVAAASAMTLVGPRVYAAMAEDGVLPRILRAAVGRPPAASIAFQSALALLILFTHTLQEVLMNVGAILTFFTALVAVAVLRERLRPTGRSVPNGLTVTGAVIQVGSAAAMMHLGLRRTPVLLVWIGVVAAVALGAYVMTTRRRRLLADVDAAAPHGDIKP